jgi:hypothetical protein
VKVSEVGRYLRDNGLSKYAKAEINREEGGTRKKISAQ